METPSYQHTVSEAEKNLLAHIINTENKPVDILPRLQPENFSKAEHQTIYRAILKMISEIIPVNRITLKAHLQHSGNFENAGGENVVEEICALTCNEITADEYYKMVVRASKKRRMGELGSMMMSESNDAAENPDENWEEAMRELTRINQHTFGSGIKSFEETSTTLLHELEVKYNSGEITSGIKSGFADLDSITGGFQPGELLIVAARPAMGKSAFLLSTVIKTCLNRKIPVAYFSLEMSAQLITQRLLSQVTRIPNYSISSAQLQSLDYAVFTSRVHETKNAPFYIVDQSPLSMQQIRLLAIQLKQQFNIEILMVDYLQLISPGKKNWNREHEISEISRALKQIARELNIVVIATSQLSRAPETRGGDKKPILSDLRDSGSLEQDADKVLFIYRAEYYGFDTDCEGLPTKDVAEIIVAKNRCGNMSTARLHFISRYAQFDNFGDGGEAAIRLSEHKLKNKYSDVFREKECEPRIDPPPF